MTPKLSVIIPVYNAACYLRQTLDSVLNQSLRDIEVICVDDGSTDESPAILQEYAGKDSRVQLLRQENLHAGVARNAGMAVAKGEYLHFLDADDYVLDYAYEAIYNKAVKYDLDCLKFGAVAYDEVRQVPVDRPSITMRRLRTGDYHRLLTLEKGSPIYEANVAPWSGIYRRTFLLEKGITFNNLLCVNDLSFFYHVITTAPRVMFSRDVLVVHRIASHRLEEGVSLVGQRDQHFACFFRSVELIQAQLAEDQVDDEASRIVMGRVFRDCLDWCKTYYLQSPQGESILEQTEEFVRDYSGLYPELLQQCFREEKKRLNQPKKEEESKEILFWREACERPKVSVVLPIYNVEDYLNEALYSLSVQTLNEMEFLCVNDGSTDGSMAIIQEYANVDKRFRILDGPNGGYGKAMNRGIDAARGKYLGILEPDDFVPPKMFQVLYRTASKNQLDFVKADFYRFVVNKDGSLKKTLFRLTNDKSYYNRLVNPSEDIQTFKFEMNTWNGIYSLDFLNRWHIRHNETPGASYQDNGFWFQTFCRATRAWFLDRAFYMNRRDNPNSSVFNRKKLYCVTDEYRYLWNWMSQEPELLEKFTPIFYAKKFSNSIVTYRRLAPEYQLEYLHHICDEFRPALAAGVLDEELLGNTYWKQLHEILADPDAYHEKIKVSVIMPVYNAEQCLRQTLDSLLVRNETEFEVICVDDGSTDGSLDILREYEAKDFRVRVITQPNGGAGAARNNGMQYARGEYLSFLDADDFFEPDMLRLAYDRAHTLGTDITVFRCDQYFEATGEYAAARYTINDSLLPAEQPFAGEDIRQDIFKAFAGWAWDKVFRTDFVRENHLRFQEQRTSNDVLFVFSAIVKAQRISTMNAILAHHRRDSGSLSVTREKSWDCFYHALCALRQQLRDWNLYDRFEQDFVNYSAHFALWNVTTLRGPSYHKLYEKLTTQWADDLGITAHEEDYFYHPGEYRKMQLLLSSTSEEFLFEELDTAKAQSAALQADKNRLQGQVRNLRNERKGLENRVELLRQENREQRADKKALREQNQSLQKERKALQKELKALQKEKKALQAKNKAIKQSTIWKVGRIITWLPRKLKRLFAGKR
ncbi:MAG: glycosyltransferase [Clostridiales bacterium]|nr:glycosyltransferase [Clostridiales bacterium]